MPKFCSFLVALLFGIHPIHTEAVAWVSGRSDLLSTLFYLASLLCFIRFVTNRFGKRPMGLYFFSCALFFFSLLTKEMAVTLPLILLAWSILFWKRERPKKEKWKEMFQFLLPFFIVLLIYLWWRKTVVGEWLYSQNDTDFLFLGLQTTIWIILKYLQLLFFPLQLSAFYDINPGSKGLNVAVLSGLIVLLLLSFFCIFYLRKKDRKIILFGVLWFPLTLLPVANLIPTTNIYLAERYLYLPSLGYLILVGWFLGELLSGKILRSSSLGRFGLIGVLSALSLFYLWKTVDRNGAWKDDLAFSQTLLEVDSKSAIGHYYLGMTYAQLGDNDKSKREYEMALKLKPGMKGVHFNLGIIHYQEGRLKEAKVEFKEEIRIDSSYTEAYYNLGTIYKNEGKIDSAILLLERARKTNPGFASALINLAIVYEAKGSYRQALNTWLEARKFNNDPTWSMRIAQRIENLEETLRLKEK
jgi:tetratricopeptide (TPR) repeat protein